VDGGTLMGGSTGSAPPGASIAAAVAMADNGSRYHLSIFHLSVLDWVPLLIIAW